MLCVCKLLLHLRFLHSRVYTCEEGKASGDNDEDELHDDDDDDDMGIPAMDISGDDLSQLSTTTSCKTSSTTASKISSLVLQLDKIKNIQSPGPGGSGSTDPQMSVERVKAQASPQSKFSLLGLLEGPSEGPAVPKTPVPAQPEPFSILAGNGKNEVLPLGFSWLCMLRSHVWLTHVSHLSNWSSDCVGLEKTLRS